MLRDFLGTIDTGILAQIGLFAFMIAFVAVLVYAFTMRRDVREAAKQIPLTDPDEFTPDPN